MFRDQVNKYNNFPYSLKDLQGKKITSNAVFGKKNLNFTSMQYFSKWIRS